MTEIEAKYYKLLTSIDNGDLDKIKSFLGENLDLNGFRGSSRRSFLKDFIPLHHAVTRNKLEVAKLLLKLPNIEINKENYFGKTALEIAFDLDLRELAKLLIFRNIFDFGDKFFLVISSKNAKFEEFLLIEDKAFQDQLQLIKLLKDSQVGFGEIIDFFDIVFGLNSLDCFSTKDLKKLLPIFSVIKKINFSDNDFKENCQFLTKSFEAKNIGSLKWQVLVNLLEMVDNTQDYFINKDKEEKFRKNFQQLPENIFHVLNKKEQVVIKKFAMKDELEISEKNITQLNVQSKLNNSIKIVKVSNLASSQENLGL